MQTYIYIVAYVPAAGDLRFRHCFLAAETEDAAYTEGMQTLDDAVIAEHGLCLVNNYVIHWGG